MIFSSKNLIPAAAFAAVASVAISAPAQALSLTGTMEFSGAPVTLTGSGEGALANYNFNFGGPQDIKTQICSGSFLCAPSDSINFYNFAINNGSVVPTKLIDGIATTEGNDISFFLTGVDTDVTGSGVTFGLSGYFAAALDPKTVLSSGSFTTQIKTGATTFSGNLEAVPTPAAVLPILAGLFGAASKRKRDGEEA